MSKNQLCVFVKNPVLGQVKTRLAKSIGDVKALEVYLKLLQHTKKTVDQLTCDVTIWYADSPAKNDIWDKYQKKKQVTGDLGEKMVHAITESISGSFDKTCIIGSDCPGITSEIINSAFESLENNDVVIGPASDGGYYLIGMKSDHRALFDNMSWSTNTVLAKTIETAINQGLSYQLLSELSDIDTIDDLIKFNNTHYM